MKDTEIVQREDPVLRKIAKEVGVEEISSRKIQTLIRRMQKALNAEEDGVAIAAPQVGESLRIFVVSKKTFDIINPDKKDNANQEDLIFINPEIIKLSREKYDVEEGCLSVRWLYGKVTRSKKATIKAYGIDGKEFTIGASGLLAQIFQHETDHLNGMLFIDKARDVEDIPPAKRKSL